MDLPYFNLNGKVAVVTGGASGIGWGIAQGLADAGAAIVLAGRGLDACRLACEQIRKRTGAETLAVRCDVRQAVDAKGLVAAVEKAMGKIDILVNNAGVGGSEKPMVKMSDSEWEDVVATNLNGVFFLSRAAATAMARRKAGGKIINVASIGAWTAFKRMSAYCASKAACLQLTKVMALELAPDRIQVNAILPGYFKTPMNQEFFATAAGKAIIERSIPMQRIGRVDELRGVAVLLASAASNFITGSAIVVDGGHTCS